MALSASGEQRLESEEARLRKSAAEHSIFLNASTLETELVESDKLRQAILDTLENQNLGPTLSKRVETWKEGQQINSTSLMLMIGYVSKGRFASELVEAIENAAPPDYIRDAITHVVDQV